jgi:hypothetical protein
LIEVMDWQPVTESIVSPSSPRSTALDRIRSSVLEVDASGSNAQHIYMQLI